MQKLINGSHTPPGGFNDRDPDTKMYFKASNLADLVKMEIRHRTANNLPIDNLADIIEARLCSRMPTGICRDTETSKINVSHSKPIENLINRTLRIDRESRLQAIQVSKDEANRRADICADCQHNVSYSGGCASCRGIGAVVKQALAGRTVNAHAKVKSCELVGMLVIPLVYTADKIIYAAVKDRRNKYPSKCWLSKGG